MTNTGENYIRFDWAMKRLLRNKANHAVLEGFLSSLIGCHFKIERFLEIARQLKSMGMTKERFR